MVDCLRAVFVFQLSNRIIAVSLGKARKRDVFVTCESAFCVAGVGLCGTQAKVASRLSNCVAAHCPWGKLEKVMFCDV